MSKTKARITQVMLQRERWEGGRVRLARDVVWIRSGLAKLDLLVRSEETGLTWRVAEVYGSREADDIEWVYKAWRSFAEKLDGH